MSVAHTLSVAHSLADIVVALPVAARVLHRHRLDFCCQGARSLSAACATAQIDADRVLDEILALATEPISSEPHDFAAWSDAQVVEYLVERYHAPLREELPRLLALVDKVTRAHHARDVRLTRLKALFEDLAAMLLEHLVSEERALFPWIIAGDGRLDARAVSSMEREHQDVARALGEIHALTDAHTAPSHACVSWRALIHGLETFERELMEHIHVENNVLFPRIVARAVAGHVERGPVRDRALSA